MAKRYLLAAKVAERAKRGDSIGDPKELLGKFKMLLAKYSEVEPEAKEWLRLNEEVGKSLTENQALINRGEPPNHDKLKALRLQRDKSGDRDRGSTVTFHMAQHGFGKLQETGKLLCWAILQQLVLPPKLRKSIEVAAKFWSRDARMRPHGTTMDSTIQKRVMLYLEHLEVFRKHVKLFDEAIRQGKSHAEAGELVTKYRGGPFTLVNTGGFDAEVMKEKARLCEEAAHKMSAIGLSKVCYGDVLIANRLSGESTQAFYLVAKDEMFVRADARVVLDTVRVMCHELTHRLETKFLESKKQAIIDLYRKINTHSMYLSNTEMPSIGTPITYDGKSMKVTDYDRRRKTVKIEEGGLPKCFVCAEKGRTEHVPDEEHKIPIYRREAYTMPVQTFYRLQGKEFKADPLDFITAYAKRGGPSENFAEMVSFWAVGKLPQEQIDMLLPILQ